MRVCGEKQSRAQKAAQEAAELHHRARKALEDAEADSASVSEEELEQHTRRRDKSPWAKGHKRVNFSETSQLRTNYTAADRDRDNNVQSESSQAVQTNGGKPQGHP